MPPCDCSLPVTACFNLDFYLRTACQTHHRLLVFIGFDAADEERLTDAQSSHQQLQRSFKLAAQGGRTLPGFCSLNTHTHTHSNNPVRNNEDSSCSSWARTPTSFLSEQQSLTLQLHSVKPADWAATASQGRSCNQLTEASISSARENCFRPVFKIIIKLI